MDLNEMDEYFAYTKWLSDAMVDVFRKTLSSLSNKLPEDNHHLYINFLYNLPYILILYHRFLLLIKINNTL